MARKKKSTRKKRTKKASRRGPGRPKGSGASKSDRVRALLGSGMSVAEIAAKVGCTTNLVYIVKGKRGKPKTRRGPGRPRKARAVAKARPATTGFEGLVDSVRAIERERDQLKKALQTISAAVDDALRG